MSADTSTSSSVNRAEDKVGDSLDEVAGMIRYTLSAYESKVRPLCIILDVRTVKGFKGIALVVKDGTELQGWKSAKEVCLYCAL